MFLELEKGKKLAYIIPFMMGFLFAGADQFIKYNGYFEWYDSAFLIKVIFYSTLFTILFSSIRYMVLIYMRNRDLNQKLEFKNRKKEMGEILKYWVIIILAWLPTYVCLFPGVVDGDTAIMIVQALSGEKFRDWHPFFDTILFGKFAAIKENNIMFGVGIYCTILMLLASILCSVVVWYCGVITGNRPIRRMVLVLFVLPIAPITFMRMDKDGIFSFFFTLYCICYCELFRSKLRILKSGRYDLLLGISIIGACLTKKTGIYVVVFSLLMVAAINTVRKLRVLVVIIGMSVFVIIQIFIPKFLFPIINVEKGPISEALAVPIQQIAKVTCMYPEDFSTSDIQIINDIISVGFENIPENYDDYLVDPIKGMGIKNEDSLGDFIKLWCRELIKHPWVYICTELGLESGWVSFENHYGYPNVYNRAVDSEVCNFMAPEVKWPYATKLSQIYSYCYETITEIPLINIVFYTPIWAMCVPMLLLFLFFTIDQIKIRDLVMFAPLILSMALLWICPVSTHLRYMIPMFFGAPLFVALLINHYSMSMQKSEVNYG